MRIRRLPVHSRSGCHRYLFLDRPTRCITSITSLVFEAGRCGRLEDERWLETMNEAIIDLRENERLRRIKILADLHRRWLKR